MRNMRAPREAVSLWRSVLTIPDPKMSGAISPNVGDE